MADIQEKNPSVELDTDGVNDQTIEVETPTESTTEFEKKEDVDLGLRLNRMGEKCIYVPKAIVYHIGSSTLEDRHPIILYYSYRNNRNNYWRRMWRCRLFWSQTSTTIILR